MPGAFFVKTCAIMEGVMQMKKILTIILALVLLLAGLFIWKGGHHALFLADALEEWIDEDQADQHLTVQVSRPDFTVAQDDTLQPEVEQFSVFADTFWMPYADRRIYGLCAGGCTAYVLDGNLYMDTGKAYSLPEIKLSSDQIRELITAMVLYGRVTKDESIYHATMEHNDMSIHVSITADQEISSLSLNADFTFEGAPVHLYAALTSRPDEVHAIPEAVSDAIVHCAIEPPMALTEPLKLLVPALENLLPLRAQLTLGVECGILTLSETVELSADGEQAWLIRNGERLPLSLPEAALEADPALMAFALLREVDYIHEGDTAEFSLRIPAETTAALATQLVPQLQPLGISFHAGNAILRIENEKLSTLSLTASAEVPFLITMIPLSFSAELQIP